MDDMLGHALSTADKMSPATLIDYPQKKIELVKQEAEVMERLSSSFIHCEKLQRHVKLMLKKGSMYRIYNVFSKTCRRKTGIAGNTDYGK